MTLGGLALAVGILVDDATVTIENINYHLEQGKDIETAIMDGARQIVVPATVSLLCICIVFVPMFTLGGVAGFLFRPMAEAVVFALIGSYRALAHAGADDGAAFCLRIRRRTAHGAAPRRRRAIRSSASSADSSARFERVRSGFHEPAATRARPRWRLFVVGFHGGRRGLVRARAVPRPELLPDRRRRPDQAARARADRHRASRRPAQLSTTSKRRSAQIIPPDELDTIVDNIGLPISGINIAYSNSGTIGAATPTS